MNNTYPVTGGSPQRCDPTGSVPLTCCAAWALEKEQKKMRQLLFFFPPIEGLLSRVWLRT